MIGFMNFRRFSDFWISDFNRDSHRRCSIEKRVFLKIHRKAPVTESLFNKVAGLRPTTLLTKRLWHKCFFCEFCEIFKDTLFLSLSYTYVFINNEIKPGNKLSSVDQNICESKRLEACNVIKKETPT